MAPSIRGKPKNPLMEALSTATNVAQVVVHYGYVPFILYLGFRRGADPGTPPLTLLSLLWQ